MHLHIAHQICCWPKYHMWQICYNFFVIYLQWTSAYSASNCFLSWDLRWLTRPDLDKKTLTKILLEWSGWSFTEIEIMSRFVRIRFKIAWSTLLFNALQLSLIIFHKTDQFSLNVLQLTDAIQRDLRLVMTTFIRPYYLVRVLGTYLVKSRVNWPYINCLDNLSFPILVRCPDHLFNDEELFETRCIGPLKKNSQMARTATWCSKIFLMESLQSLSDSSMWSKLQRNRKGVDNTHFGLFLCRYHFRLLSKGFASFYYFYTSS